MNAWKRDRLVQAGADINYRDGTGYTLLRTAAEAGRVGLVRAALSQTAQVFLGWSVDLWGPGGKAIRALAVIAFEIYVCFWLYRSLRFQRR